MRKKVKKRKKTMTTKVLPAPLLRLPLKPPLKRRATRRKRRRQLLWRTMRKIPKKACCVLQRLTPPPLPHLTSWRLTSVSTPPPPRTPMANLLTHTHPPALAHPLTIPVISHLANCAITYTCLSTVAYFMLFK